MFESLPSTDFPNTLEWCRSEVAHLEGLKALEHLVLQAKHSVLKKEHLVFLYEHKVLGGMAFQL